MRSVSSTSRDLVRQVFASVCILMLCCATALAQTMAQDVFAPVPEVRRARLIERLKLLIEYQKAQQWEKQYDLLSSLTTRAEGKKDFVSRTRKAYTMWGRTPLLSFEPQKVGQIKVDMRRKVWFIAGCSQVLEKGRKVNKLAFIEAYWERGDWFFSEVQNIGTGASNDPCTQQYVPVETAAR
ncbi:MAG TPA: hypothetical protein VGB17_08915 [Pyrinomonadaceae bacterium]